MIEALMQVLSVLRRSARLAIGVASGLPIKEAARLIELSGDPTSLNIEMWLSAEGLRYRVEPLTRSSTWLLALVLTSLQGIRPRECREVTRYYNQRLSGLDRSEPAHQTLLEIEVDS